MRRLFFGLMAAATFGFLACSNDTPGAGGGNLPGDRGVGTEDTVDAGSDARPDADAGVDASVDAGMDASDSG